MLLRELAPSPRTPQFLLDHLITTTLATRPAPRADYDTQSAYWPTAADLASNPNVPPRTVVELAKDQPLQYGGSHIIKSALTRPGLTPHDAIEILETTRLRTLVTLALKHVPDPDGVLVTYALAHGEGNPIWDAVLVHPASTHAQRWDALVRLLTDGAQVSQSARGHIKRELLRRLAATATQAEHTALREQILSMRRPVPGPQDTSMSAKLDRYLNTLLEALPTQWKAPKRGTLGWLAREDTSDAEAVTWANEHGADAWLQVLKVRNDPHGILAKAALAAHPEDRKLATRVFDDESYSVTTRQRAALTLAVTGQLPDVYKLQALLEAGDGGNAVQLTGYCPNWVREHLLEHPDLSTEDLEVARHMNIGESPRGRALFGVWLATHPAATADMRRQGRKIAARTKVGDRDALVSFAIERTEDLDGSDPSTVAAVGRSLTCDVLTKDTPLGIAWLVHAALDSLMTEDTAPTFASTLLRLEPDFPGTLADLVTTTTAILL